MEGIAIIIFCILLCIDNSKSRKNKVQKEYDRCNFARQYPDIQRAIDESVEVLNRTGEVETAIQSFAVIKSNLSRIKSLSPDPLRYSIKFGSDTLCHEIELESKTALESFDDLEKKWLRGHFVEKIETLMKHSGDTEDSVLKAEFMRDALRTALKGIEYLPDNNELKAMAESAEQRLGSILH